MKLKNLTKKQKHMIALVAVVLFPITVFVIIFCLVYFMVYDFLFNEFP